VIAAAILDNTLILDGDVCTFDANFASHIHLLP